jgi:hypothetical protein
MSWISSVQRRAETCQGAVFAGSALGPGMG